VVGEGKGGGGGGGRRGEWGFCNWVGEDGDGLVEMGGWGGGDKATGGWK